MANLESLKELFEKIEIKKAVNHNHFAIYSGGGEGCDLDNSEILERLSALENKTDNDTIYDDSEIISEIATIKTQIETLSAQGYDDTAITARIEALEAKTDNDTIYDDSAVVARIEALEAKTDNDTIYDDSAIIARVEALENRTDSDTIYDDTALSARVSALENSSSGGGYDDSEILARLSEAERSLEGAHDGVSDAHNRIYILRGEFESEISAVKANTKSSMAKSVTVDNITIAPNSRVNIQQEINNIGEYQIANYKQIAIEKATNASGTTAESWKNVFIQSFATAGSNKKCNISLFNNGSSEALVKLVVVAMCEKPAF